MAEFGRSAGFLRRDARVSNIANSFYNKIDFIKQVGGRVQQCAALLVSTDIAMLCS